jgi:DNA-binding transcriptional LysR family regulator
VQRQPTGYRLTAFGQEMLPFAKAVERSVQAFERQLHTLGTETAGVIRLTCPGPIVNRIMQTGLLDRFHARHPALRVQFVMSDKYIDLSQGDADVALRSGDTDDDELVGRKIGDSIWAVYASRTCIERHGQPAEIEDLAEHALVGFDDTMAGHRIAHWLRKVAPDAQMAARSSQQQRSRPDLFGPGRHRHRAPAAAAWRRGARSGEGVGPGNRAVADLAPADDA